jgi:hypothetical protein
MLEQPSLLIHPWKRGILDEPDRFVREIAGPEGSTVGFVRRPRPGLPPWLLRLARPRLKAYEAPDGSLVFTIRRSWGWRSDWKVFDADGHQVGTVRGRALLDSFGQIFAVIEQPDTAASGRFLTLEGQELGEFSSKPEGTGITFGPKQEDNPFAKMLLLGAVLVLGEGRT